MSRGESMRHIIVKSKKLKEVINITRLVEGLLDKHPAEDGMIHLFLVHTTAALTTALIEENVDLDMLGAFEVMLPHRAFPEIHDFEHTHHTGHLASHTVASLLGPHLAIPVIKNKLKLGKYQSVVLLELNGPREREILIDYQERPKTKK